jgi:streptogramin lyase
MLKKSIYHRAERVYIDTFRGMITLMFLMLFFTSAGAQIETEYHITWIGQYPEKAGRKTASFGERFSRIVFGQNEKELVKPFNIVADDPEHFWILDQGAGGIFEVKEGEGSMIRSMRKSDQDYPSLVGLCRTSGLDLLFTDSRLNRVQRVAGEKMLNFSDTLTLNQPTGIACDRTTGHIWVVETGGHQLTLFDSEGRLIRKIGGRGTGPGLFNYPTFIWIDQEGRIYIVDSMNYRIQIFNSKGAFLDSFGETGDATGYMARPKGVATDSKGHIYVADALFHAVQIFDYEGRFLYSFGSQGQGKGEFWMPAGLFIDEQDHIYVADSYNSRIQVFKLEKN